MLNAHWTRRKAILYLAATVESLVTDVRYKNSDKELKMT